MHAGTSTLSWTISFATLTLSRCCSAVSMGAMQHADLFGDKGESSMAARSALDILAVSSKFVYIHEWSSRCQHVIIAASSSGPYVSMALVLGASVHERLHPKSKMQLWSQLHLWLINTAVVQIWVRYSVCGRLQLYWGNVALCSTQTELYSSPSAIDYEFVHEQTRILTPGFTPTCWQQLIFHISVLWTIQCLMAKSCYAGICDHASVVIDCTGYHHNQHLMIHCHGAEPTQIFTTTAATCSRVVLHAGAWNRDHI